MTIKADEAKRAALAQAKAVREYWLSKGVTPTVWVEAVKSDDRKGEPVYAVRSKGIPGMKA